MINKLGCETNRTGRIMMNWYWERWDDRIWWNFFAYVSKAQLIYHIPGPFPTIGSSTISLPFILFQHFFFYSFHSNTSLRNSSNSSPITSTYFSSCLLLSTVLSQFNFTINPFLFTLIVRNSTLLISLHFFISFPSRFITASFQISVHFILWQLSQILADYFLSGMPRSFRNFTIALFSSVPCSFGKPPCLPPSMVMNSAFTPASCNFLWSATDCW